MFSTNNIKLLHAGQQDLEIFNYIRDANKPIQNLFDTQVAALFAGYGETISLEALILKTTGVHIDKTHRTTNWLHRPLSDAQKEYALTDVRYLPQAYRVLNEELTAKGRLEWVLEEMVSLESNTLSNLQPSDQWKRIQGASQSKSAQWLLKELWLWRERNAKTLNTPRSWLLSEHHLKALIKKKPNDVPTLHKISPSLTKYTIDSDELIKIIQTPHDPEAEEQAIKSTPLSKKELLLYDMLSILLNYVSDRLVINVKLIAKKSDLIQFIRDRISPTQGWRYQEFWALAEKMIDGKIHLYISNNEIMVNDI